MPKFLVALALAFSAVAAGVAIYCIPSANDRDRLEVEDLAKEVQSLRGEVGALAAQLRALEAEDKGARGGIALSGSVANDDATPPDAEESVSTAHLERAGARRRKAALANVIDEGNAEDRTAAALAAALTGEGATDETKAALEERVRETVESLREEEREERRERRKERRLEMTKERVRGYSEKLGLASCQEDELVRIYTDQGNRRDDIWDRVREDEITPQEGRTLTEESRKETDSEVQRVLSAQQFADLEAIQKTERDAMGPGPWRGAIGGAGASDAASAAPAPVVPPSEPPRPPQ